MPQLTIFAACDKVLINEEDQSVSLIQLLDTIGVHVPKGTDFSADMLLPGEWYLFAFWHKTPDDDGRQFEERFTLILPDGEEREIGVLALNLSKSRHRGHVRVSGFPISQQGRYTTKVYLRETTHENENWEEKAFFFINVAHRLID